MLVETMCFDSDYVSSETTSDYWSEVERINQMIKQRIINDGPYILESSFKIEDPPLEICCGMSVARCFEPAIRLKKNNDSISFNTSEWASVMFIFRKLLIEFMEMDSDPAEVQDLDSDEQVKITPTTFMHIKILKVQSATNATI